LSFGILDYCRQDAHKLMHHVSQHSPTAAVLNFKLPFQWLKVKTL